MLLQTRKTYEQIFDRQSKRGRAQLIQTEKFMRRITSLREQMVVCVLALEHGGVYLPSVITQLQQMLPVLERTGVGVIDKPTSSRKHVFRLITGIGQSY